MSNKNRKTCTTVTSTENFLTLVFTVTRCIFISFFSSLVDVSLGVFSSKTGVNICTINGRTKKYKSIIKKKRSMVKEHY